MNITQGFKMALKSIFGNKLRSFLTMLGIIIGVSAVIALISLAQGTTKQITDRVQSLGSNLLTVRITGQGTKSSLTYEEAESFAEKPGVKAVAPIISGSVKAKYGTKNADVSASGIDPAYEDVRDYHVQAGRFILPIDIQYRQKVALIGTETASNLFGSENPLNKDIYLNGVRFQVVGLLAEKGSSMSGSNDDVILVPITTAERLLRNKGIKNMYIQAETPDDVDAVMAVLEIDLNKKFPTTQSQEGNNREAFRIYNQQETLDTVSSITTTMTLMLGGIAGISLLVGGIGIMNIMLVSVSERTREIGIRKAIGARRRDILTQFLIESMVLGGTGGIIGILVGIGGAQLIARFIQISVVLSSQVIIISFSFSLFIGIFFGLLPANKASKLKPIEALKFE